MKTLNRSEILKNAWRLFRNGIFTFSECLKVAWSKAQFAEMQFQDQQKRLVQMNLERSQPKLPIMVFDAESNANIVGQMVGLGI